jgi:MarR family transcriptional regulator, organic hydroperoxide resistance regulator
MSTSKPSKHRSMSVGIASHTMPLSVSAPSLLRAGSDRMFQKLIFDLFTISARIERVRVHFASKMGVSRPQYSVLRAVALLQGNEGVSVGIVAEHLQVTSEFITAQSGMLTRRGFLRRKNDLIDRRISRLSLTQKGRHLVDDVIKGIRPINDLFFGGLDKSEFDTLAATLGKLVDSSRNAIDQISVQDQHQR